MTERLLAAGLQQALLLSLSIVLLRVVRPLLLRQGAGLTYAAWWAVPMLLLTPALPRPGAEPLRLMLAATGSPAAAGLPAIPAPPPGSSARWLALWLAGTLAVLAAQTWRQWRLARLGQRLPAGSSPALVGLLRPRVALPLDFEARFTPQERELILAHEQVHRARLDNLWNLLATLLTALHWWNPLAWWAARRLRADQELACDATVLASRPGAVAGYTRALLAAHALTPHGAPLASRWGTTHPLVERIAMLKQPRPSSRRRTTALGLAMLAMLAIAGLAYAAQGGAPGGDASMAQKVEIRLELDSAGSTAKPRLITALGVPARIEWGTAPDQVWRLDLTVDRSDDGRLQVVTLPSYAGKALGRHTGVIASGATFGHRLGGADGVPVLQMTRVVTLLPADFQLPPKAGAAAQPGTR
jgi:beta-lactamase regulating signal transducer with metallopeptidase domain